MLPPELLPFLIASLLIELTPGPNMTWLAVLTLSDGRMCGMRAVAGISLGLAILGAAGAFGATQIIQSSRLVYETLRWAGILFLFYLAWEGWRGGSSDVDDDEAEARQAFYRGLVTNILNPKAAVFYITVLPAFVVDGAPLKSQTWFLTAGYVAVATAVHSGIVLLAGRVQPLLMDPRREKTTRRVLSLVLVAVAVWFAYSTRL